MTTDAYLKMIDRLVSNGRPFEATRESVDTVQVERGSLLAEQLFNRPVPPLPTVPTHVVDASGHRRPMYRPLLVHALDRAGYDVGAWTAGSLSFAPLTFTAAAGAATAAALWSALAIARHEPFRQVVAAQQCDGRFLRSTSSDNPETHWFHELVILHAAADFALETGDGDVWSAVERAAAFHLNETEPDHATGQPWGLPAFVRIAGAEPLADALLHAVAAHQPNGASGVALLLLADTLYGLRHLPLAPEKKTP